MADANPYHILDGQVTDRDNPMHEQNAEGSI